MQDNKIDHVLKMICVGDPCVGKSAFMTRFAEDSYSNKFVRTLGRIEFKVRVLKMEDKLVKCMIYDQPRPERFKAFTFPQNHFHGVRGIFIMYSVGDVDSFVNVRLWHSEIKKFGSFMQMEQEKVLTVPVCLVGNKCEQADSARAVTYEDGVAMASELGIPLFFECSCKAGMNVNESVVHLAKYILDPPEVPDPVVAVAEVAEESASEDGSDGQFSIYDCSIS